jgi:hypothetical protein
MFLLNILIDNKKKFIYIYLFKYMFNLLKKNNSSNNVDYLLYLNIIQYILYFMHILIPCLFLKDTV